MTRLTQPLRDEHRELCSHADEMLAVADELAARPPAILEDRFRQLASFLRHDLPGHAAAEKAAPYPLVGRLMGAPEATLTMSRDHREIEGMAGALERLMGQAATGRPDRDDLQRLLYGLHAAVTLHFAKEEEVCLPLLDERLTPEAASRRFTDLEAAAAKAAGMRELTPAG